MVLNIDLPTGTVEMIFIAIFISNDAAIEVDREGSVMDTHIYHEGKWHESVSVASSPQHNSIGYSTICWCHLIFLPKYDQYDSTIFQAAVIKYQ